MAASPRSPFAHIARGQVLRAQDRYKEAIPHGRIAIAHLLQSRIDEAIVWSEKSRDANPARAFPHSALAAAFALKGDTKRAATELAEAQKLNYDFYRSLARLKARYFEIPEIRALFEATYGAGLRKAGVPEE